MAQVTCQDLLSLLESIVPATIPDNPDLILMLESFRGSCDTDEEKEALLSKLQSASETVSSLREDLKITMVQVENERAWTAALIDQVTQAAVEIETAQKSETQTLVVADADAEMQAILDNSKQKKLYLDRKKHQLDRSLCAAQAKQECVAMHAEKVESKLAQASRLQFAAASASHYVQDPKIGLFTVMVDTRLGVLTCVSASGEEIIPAQTLDATIGGLINLVSQVAADAYVQLVSQNGTLLDGADDDLVWESIKHSDR